MARKIPLIKDEYYHIFNRGVDKRDVFLDKEDQTRFLQSMKVFNSLEPVGSIYEYSFQEHRLGNGVSKLLEPLVEFICYCLNPNHYHFLVRQLVDDGIAKFMHRISLGYTKYFNERHERNGVLFQGPFKAVHISSNEQLFHVSIYINLNDRLHKIGKGVSKSSWSEYSGGGRIFCNPEIILGQLKSSADYKKIAEESILLIRERRDLDKLLLE